VDFALTVQNARAVAQVCVRLDGIPLAIELAAARVGSLVVEAIAARLDDRFRLLTGGARDTLPRQRTLRATLDWSYDLLSEAEQLLLVRLSVFAGGWRLVAAEAVCAGAGVEAWEVLDLLDGLVNKSLVQVTEAGGEVRCGLLETVRQYGQARLAASGEEQDLYRRHAAYFLALAEAAEPQLVGPEQGTWLARLEAEHDNLRAALSWAGERSASDLGLRLVGALLRFWETRGFISEGRRWLEGALAGGGGSPAARVRALNGAGAMAYHQSEYSRAAALHEEALALRRALGDRLGIADSLNNLGRAAYSQGEYGRAVALYEEALALRRELDDRLGIAGSLSNLGYLVGKQGEYARSAALLEEALALYRELGDQRAVARSLQYLGRAAYRLGEYGRAEALYEQSLALRRDLGDRVGIAYSLHNLGLVAYQQSEYERAAALLTEALALDRELGVKRGIAEAHHDLGLVMQRRGEYRRAAALVAESLRLSRDLGARDQVAHGLETAAWVAAAQGQAHLATCLGGHADALREALGVPVLLEHRASHDQAVRTMRAMLGEAAFVAAWAEGRALPLEEAIALALEGHAAVSDR
jgi:tetratricopeptide (TPR) repeat protein